MCFNMVPLHRIELQTSDYKTDVIPFNYKGKNFLKNKFIVAKYLFAVNDLYITFGAPYGNRTRDLRRDRAT